MDRIKPISLTEISAALSRGGFVYPEKVIYAGTSPRRATFIQDTFKTIPFQSFDISPEPPWTDTGLVMRYKIGRAYEGNSFNGNAVVLGADTRTLTPILNNTGSISMVSRGKPKNDEELFRTFQSIHEVAKVTGEQPCYMVENSSGLLHHDVNGQTNFMEDRDNVFVMLKKEGAAHLATTRGISEYMKEFRDFYSQPPYEKSVTPFDLSGGISLPVLTKMGMIDSVDGISPDSFMFYKVLRRALHTVAIGISPELLDNVGINSANVIKHWDWINQVTKKSMGII